MYRVTKNHRQYHTTTRNVVLVYHCHWIYIRVFINRFSLVTSETQPGEHREPCRVYLLISILHAPWRNANPSPVCTQSVYVNKTVSWFINSLELRLTENRTWNDSGTGKLKTSLSQTLYCSFGLLDCGVLQRFPVHMHRSNQLRWWRKGKLSNWKSRTTNERARSKADLKVATAAHD